MGKKVASELDSEHRDEFAGGRDDAASGAMERDVDLRDVHGSRAARQDRVVRREVAARAVASQRAFDQIGLLQTKRRKDVLP
jgi:hypothetical protein